MAVATLPFAATPEVGIAEPETIAATVSLPSATATAGASVTPDTITAIAALPATAAGGVTTASPETIAVVVSIPQATPTVSIYIFRTPTYDIAHAEKAPGADSFWNRVDFRRGFGVLRQADGTFKQVAIARADEVEEALAYYRGGYENVVSHEEKVSLEAAGFQVEAVVVG